MKRYIVDLAMYIVKYKKIAISYPLLILIHRKKYTSLNSELGLTTEIESR